MKRLLENIPGSVYLTVMEAIITMMLLEIREFIIVHIIFGLFFVLYGSSSQRDHFVDRLQPGISFFQTKYRQFVEFRRKQRVHLSFKIYELMRCLLIILILTFVYIYGWFATLFGSVIVYIAFYEQCNVFLVNLNSQANVWREATISYFYKRLKGFQQHCGWDSNSKSFSFYFQIAQQIPKFFSIKENIALGCMMISITVIVIWMGVFWVVVGGGLYSIRIYKRKREVIDQQIKMILCGEFKRKYQCWLMKENFSTALNKVKINPTGKNFVNDLSSVSQEETLSVQTATSIGTKVIMDIKDKPLQDIEVKKAPTRIQYSGPYVEIGPERKEETKSSENGQFLKIVIGSGSGSGSGITRTNGSESYYLNPHTFNYIELQNGGQITRERPIVSKPQDFKPVNVRVETPAQEIKEKIVSIQRSYEKRTERQLGQFNKKGYEHQLTKEQREDNLVLVLKLNEILGRINYYINLDSQTIIKDFKCKGPYKVIHPNFKIEISTELRIAIRVSDNNGRHYYFSNPEYLPIFFEEIPPVISDFLQSKNASLKIKRDMAQNDYSDKFILSDKQTVLSTKVLIINKLQDTYYSIKDLHTTVSESGFQIFYQLDQDYHVIWIISDQYQKLTHLQLTFIKQQYHKGAGLFIWADNEPLYADANRVLKELGFSFHLQGDYDGQKILKASHQLNRQTFDSNHPVSSGFQTLYQGVTICYPNKITDGFNVFAYNSNPSVLQPASIYKKGTIETGGIWIDTGFTKLEPECHINNRSEVIRYFTNASLYIRKKEYLT